MKPWLLAGDLSYVATLLLCAGAFFIGEAGVRPHDKVAVAEKGGVVLEAVLARGDASPERIDAEVTKPIVAVLSKYAGQGYLVVDVSKDAAGNMAVAAVPADAIDITAEMRAAVRLAPAQPASTP